MFKGRKAQRHRGIEAQRDERAGGREQVSPGLTEQKTVALFCRRRPTEKKDFLRIPFLNPDDCCLTTDD